MLDGDVFSLQVSSLDNLDAKTFKLRKVSDSALGLEVVGIGAHPSHVDVPFLVADVKIEVSVLDGPVCHSETASIVGDSVLAVFDGNTGRQLESDGVIPIDGRTYSVIFPGADWRWSGPEDDLLDQVLAGDWWLVQVAITADSSAIVVDEERIWPPEAATPGSVDGPGPLQLTRIYATCGRADEVGETTVSLSPVPLHLDPLSFSLRGTKYAVKRIGPDRAEARVAVSPALVLDRASLRPRLLAWDTARDRKRSVVCEWNGDPLAGFAIHRHDRWEMIKSSTDRSLLEGSKMVRLHQPDGRDRLLMGSQICGAVKDSMGLYLTTQLGGWGEPLLACAGPNDLDSARMIVRSILDSGRIDRVSALGAASFQVDFRSGSYEYDPANHQIEFWLVGANSPVAGNFVSAADNSWTIRGPEGDFHVAGVAIFHQKHWIGTRWFPGVGLGALERTIQEAPDWSVTMPELIRWKAPLLHDSLKRQVTARALAEPAATLRAILDQWIPGSEPRTPSASEKLLLREAFRDWVPDQQAAPEQLLALRLLPGDPTELFLNPQPALSFCLLALPLVTVGLVIHGLRRLYLGAEPKDLAALISKTIEILDRTSFASRSKSRETFADMLLDAARDLGINEWFLSSVVLKAARRFAGIDNSMEPGMQERRALQYCLSSDLAVRWLVHQLLGEYRDKLMEDASVDHK